MRGPVLSVSGELGKPLWSWGLGTLVALLTAGPAEAAASLPPVLLSRETTYITSPLTSEGLPDYGTFLDSRGDAGIPLEENAAPALFAVLGDPDHRTRKRLGLQPATTSLPRLAPPPIPDSQAYAAEHERALAGPWRPEEAPLVEAWLTDNAAALDAVAAATRRPGFWWPWRGPGVVALGMPSYLGFRQTGDGLVQRAFLRAGTGRGAEAVDDVLASLRLGCLVARGGTLLEGLVGAAVRTGVIEALPRVAGGLDPRDLDRLAAGLEGLPEVVALERHVETERVMRLGLVLELRRLGTTQGAGAWRPVVGGLRQAPEAVFAIDPAAVDWNELLRFVNRTFDVGGGDRPPLPAGPTGLVAEAVGVAAPSAAGLVLDQAERALQAARASLRVGGKR
jgi:hypothetical protein